MKKKRLRVNNLNTLFVPAAGTFITLGPLATIGGVVTLFSPNPLSGIVTISLGLLATGAGIYCLYRLFWAPDVNSTDEAILGIASQLVRDAKRLARDSHLKGDPSVAEVVKALQDDHQLLQETAVKNWKHPSDTCTETITDILNQMSEAYQALKETLDLRQDEDPALHTEPSSGEAARRLREENQVLTEYRRSLTE